MTLGGHKVPQGLAHLSDAAAREIGDDEVLGVWTPVCDGRPAVLALTSSRLVIATDGRLLSSELDGVASSPPGGRGEAERIALDGVEVRLVWGSRKDERYFGELLRYYSARAREAPSDPAPREVPTDKVTTMTAVPGTEVVRSLGVVTALSSSSVWTAGHKGQTALDAALTRLRVSAHDMGANAVVGLQVSAFGAAGGVTSVVGGDAVGVVLVGTAVKVRPLTEVSQPAAGV